MKTIYYDGDIITMTGAKDSCEALVTEDKKILYTGTLKQARALYGKEAQERDLKGHTLMPAFIDAHSHFAQTAQSIKMCDLSDTESFEDIVTALKNYLEKNQIDENGMIFATGYDHNFLAEQKHPDKTVLDKVSKTVPIYISHASGHMGAANSALLKLAGITTETKDPEGGRFGRDKSGEPDG